MVKGIVHVHSDFSRDGLSSIADLAAFAREARLRFVGLTDHAEDFSAQDVVDLRQECEEHSNGSCVILPGLEFRCRGDIHILGLGSTELICDDDPVVVASRITATGGLAILAHPGRNGHRCPEELGSVLNGIEVWNAAYDGRFVPAPASLRLLRRMRLINPSLFGIGGADLHGIDRPPGVILELPLNGCQVVDAHVILQALKAGMFLVSGGCVRFDAMRGPHPLARIPLWSLRNVYEASKTIRDMALGRGLKTAGAMAKTVLQLIETGGPGGAERMMVHLAAGLSSEYRSEAALIRDTWLGTALRERGIPVTMLRYRRKDFFTTLRDLIGLIRKKPVAILHTHEFFMNTIGLAVSWLAGVPLVATVHGRNYYAERFRRRLAYRLVGKFAGQMVAVSDDVRDFLVQRVGVPVGRIRVVSNGVPVDEKPSHERLSTLRRNLGLNGHIRVVGTVGSLYPVKGHKYLIDAAVHVIRRCPDVTFLIVGRGGLREELEAQATILGVAPYIRFLGHRDDVHDLLRICDAFVLPSLSEGMPLALLEAMAAGIPSVATRVGGVGEAIEDGESGLLVPPGDSHALAEGITKLLEDRILARQMGKYAQDVVARRFSLTKMVQAYQEIYADLLRDRNV